MLMKMCKVEERQYNIKLVVAIVLNDSSAESFPLLCILSPICLFTDLFIFIFPFLSLYSFSYLIYSFIYSFICLLLCLIVTKVSYRPTSTSTCAIFKIYADESP